MTVSELVDLLNQYGKDDRVVIWDGNMGEGADIGSVDFEYLENAVVLTIEE